MSKGNKASERANEVISEARDEVNNSISMIRNELATVSNSANKSKKSFEEAAKDVTKKLKDSNERIVSAETKYNQLTSEYEVLKNDVSAELAILKERNELVALADIAICKGDRNSFNKIVEIAYDENESPEKKSIAFAEMLRIKSFYVSGTRIPKTELKKGPNGIENNDIPTADLIQGLISNKSWIVRGIMARILGDRKEKEVPKALIQSIKDEQRLDVLEESLESFCKVTGHEKEDILASQPVLDWWEANQENVESKLPSKE